jgi:hypothetical protein
MPDGILAGRGAGLCLFFFYKKRGKTGSAAPELVKVVGKGLTPSLLGWKKRRE